MPLPATSKPCPVCNGPLGGTNNRYLPNASGIGYRRAHAVCPTPEPPPIAVAPVAAAPAFVAEVEPEPEPLAKGKKSKQSAPKEPA